MVVKVQYAGELAKFISQLPSAVEMLPGSTVHEFVQGLAAKVVDAVCRQRIVDEHNNPHRGLLVAVNGVTHATSGDIVLKDGDRLLVFTLVSGG